MINNNQLISIFFNSKPEQKKIENQEEKSGQEFQSVTKYLKKNDYLYLKSFREDCIVSGYTPE